MGDPPSEPATRRRAADVLAQALAEAGVRHVFGMPGSHVTTVYDALSLQDRVATVLVRNEQAGAFAADGYARVSGSPGVVCTTAGPGATNALTGLAEAWADSVPVVLLTGQVNADRMHLECGAYHEIDLEGILRPVTLCCETVREPSAVAPAFTRVWEAVTSGRPRPAALVLPQDVMARECEPPGAFRFRRAASPTPDPDAIRRAADLLNAARRPVILAGGGALWSGAAGEVLTIAERLQAPVVTSLNGKGLIDERHPASLGHARSARARVVLPHVDAMLAVGCRFTEVMTRWRTMPVPPDLVQVDLDPSQIGMNYPAAVGVVADSREALRALIPLVGTKEPGGWEGIWDQARAARPARPEWLIEILNLLLPADAVVFADACEMGYRLHTYLTVRGPRRFFYPSNYIALGWGFPAAVGGAVALGGRAPVVAVCGDGGFVMTSQELATAARYGLRVIAVVHNDATYGAIKNIQHRAHGGRYLDVALNNPDFVKLAEAYGVPARCAQDAESFEEALLAALRRPGPSLIEVPDRWRPIRD